MDRTNRERDQREMLGNERRPELKDGTANCSRWIAVKCYWQLNDTVAILTCLCVRPCSPLSLLDRINSDTSSQHPWARKLWSLLQRSVFHHKYHKCSLITAGNEDKHYAHTHTPLDKGKLLSEIISGFSPLGDYLRHLTLRSHWKQPRWRSVRWSSMKRKRKQRRSGSCIRKAKKNRLKEGKHRRERWMRSLLTNKE